MLAFASHNELAYPQKLQETSHFWTLAAPLFGHRYEQTMTQYRKNMSVEMKNMSTESWRTSSVETFLMDVFIMWNHSIRFCPTSVFHVIVWYFDWIFVFICHVIKYFNFIYIFSRIFLLFVENLCVSRVVIMKFVHFFRYFTIMFKNVVCFSIECMEICILFHVFYYSV